MDENNACYCYAQDEPVFFLIDIHIQNMERGEEGEDAKFITALNGEYSLLIYYFAEENKYIIKAHDGSDIVASFEILPDRDELIEGYHFSESITVEDYFKMAYNDSATTDVFHYSIELMERLLKDAFGMGIEELYALPIR